MLILVVMCEQLVPGEFWSIMNCWPQLQWNNRNSIFLNDAQENIHMALKKKRRKKFSSVFSSFRPEGKSQHLSGCQKSSQGLGELGVMVLEYKFQLA